MTQSSSFWRILPFLLLFGAYFLFRFINASAWNTTLIHNAPYIFGAVLLGFASMFNRWRYNAAILISLFAYLFIREFLQANILDQIIHVKFLLLNWFVCSALLLIAILPEKGAYNRIGLSYLFVLVACAFGLWLSESIPEVLHLGESLKGLILGAKALSSLEFNHWFGVDLMVLHGLTFLLLTLFAVFRRHVSDLALLLAWLACFIVFVDFGRPNVSSFCFSALFVSLFLLIQRSSYEVTYQDALTGIPGRRALEDYLQTLGRNYSIAMLDVDHFKKFNDTYGHDIGDQVLRMVAAQIMRVEGGGKAFRYGGEEFTIVFNRKRPADINVYLEVVRTAIQNYKMIIRGDDRDKDNKAGSQKRGSQSTADKSVSVTISIGVSGSQPGFSVKDVIKASDKLLYKAKEAGRNCTISE